MRAALDPACELAFARTGRLILQCAKWFNHWIRGVVTAT